MTLKGRVAENCKVKTKKRIFLNKHQMKKKSNIKSCINITRLLIVYEILIYRSKNFSQIKKLLRKSSSDYAKMNSMNFLQSINANEFQSKSWGRGGEDKKEEKFSPHH